ncbi:MAG: secretin N-terminal domain-containing protein, partial [FCB group bacterium]|nr:secretin N-terminal domain-containing protein [FCB group bacterium]
MLKHRGNRRRGGFAVMLVAGLLGLACTFAFAQEPPKEVPPPTPVPAAEQSPATPPGAPDDGTIAVNLNNVNIDSVVKFLSDMTGKMVIKHKDVKAQLSVFSPGKVTKERAFQLVSEALMLEKVVVLEDKDSIKLVPSEALSDMTVDITPSDSTATTGGIVKAVIDVRFADVAEIEKMVKPLLSKNGVLMAHAPSRKIIITDTASRVQAVKDIVAQVDVLDTEEREVKVFELNKADPDEIAPILKSVLTVLSSKLDASKPKGPQPQPGQPPPPPDQQGQKGGAQEKVLDVVPYKSANWIVVVAPKELIAAATSLVAELDRERPRELGLYVLPMKYADGNRVARDITTLYAKRPDKNVKETVQITADERSNSLVILCSEENFDSISKLVSQLDTEESVQLTTQTFTLKFADADDVAEQMNNLYSGMEENNRRPYWWGGRDEEKEETRFVAERRTNSVVAIAKPNEMPKITELITKLDTPIDAEQVTPRIYHLKYVDAKEVTDVLNDVFGTGESSKSGGYYDYWFDSYNKDDKQEVGRLYGKVRFVTEPTTNSIIVTTNNNENYKIIDDFIAQLDRVSSDAANTMVVPLQHAKAKELAGQLNALFAIEGARIPQQQRRQGQNGNAEEEDEDQPEYYSWMFGTQTKKKDDKRSISNLIGQVRMVPDPRTNSITITTAVQNFQMLQDLIKQLDIPTPKVNVRVRLVEVTKSKGKRIGTRFSSDASVFETDDFDNGLRTTLGLDWKQIYHNGTITGSSGTDISLLIQFMERTVDARILSEPSMTVNNNQPADIFVGAEIPFITDSQSSPEGTLNQSFDYKKAGTSLKITPNINELDRVEMKVELESSQIRPGEVLFGGLILDSRKFNTEVAVESGDTIVIGGIMRQSESKAVHNTPILGKIPVANLVFGKRDREQEATELIAFITPTVLRNRQEDAEA